jgi:UPF0716 protein FxsA
MRVFLLLAFVLVPIIEIALFLKVGSFIGIPATLGLILLTAVTGTMLVRSQGLEVLRTIQETARQGKTPVEAILHGLFVLIAGVLLLTPGFFTDFLGFALLIPSIRKAVARQIWATLEPVIARSAFVWQESKTQSDTSDIIEGEAVEVREQKKRVLRNDERPDIHR